VRTPSDFGFQAGTPSHPELLDWLAAEFLDSMPIQEHAPAAWGSIKRLHRMIMLSATYRQSTQANERSLALDKSNQLLWRMNPGRLEAEVLRDAVLATSGKLSRRMGGPGYQLWEKNTNYVVVFQPKRELGPDEFRRMVYQFKPRTQQDPTFGAFDCPDAALVAPRRNTSTTALQALNLLNSSFVLQQAEYFGQRLQSETGPDPSAQVVRGFQLAFGREPTETEHAAANDLLREHGAAAFCRALFNASEFIYRP
jgi:hypothetical protein